LYVEPLCRLCFEQGLIVPATAVADHVQPHKGDFTAFRLGALRSLCKACHDGLDRTRTTRAIRFAVMAHLPIRITPGTPAHKLCRAIRRSLKLARVAPRIIPPPKEGCSKQANNWRDVSGSELSCTLRRPQLILGNLIRFVLVQFLRLTTSGSARMSRVFDNMKKL
jgi:hypothetical protein